MRAIGNEVAKIGVGAVRAAAVNAVRGRPADGPAAPTDHDGCPYCAMWPHATLALGYCLLAANASGAEVRAFYLTRAELEIQGAVRAGVTSEVLESEGGRAALDRVQAVAEQLAGMAQGATEDLTAMAKELYAIADTLAALAEGRNAPGPAEGGEQ